MPQVTCNIMGKNLIIVALNNEMMTSHHSTKEINYLLSALLQVLQLVKTAALFYWSAHATFFCQTNTV